MLKVVSAIESNKVGEEIQGNAGREGEGEGGNVNGGWVWPLDIL